MKILEFGFGKIKEKKVFNFL